MHADELRWVLDLALMIAAARVAGEVFRRIGLSAVIGEILVGVVLGAGVLGFVHMSHAVHAFAEMGVLLLIFSLGLETKIDQLRAVGGTALAVAIGGVVVPFAAGYGLAQMNGLAVIPSLFLGAILTATSIAVSTRLLIDLGLGQSPAAKVILASAIIDDVVGLLVLTAVVAVASGGEGSLAAKFVPIGIFLVIGIPVLAYVLPRLLRVARSFGGQEAGFVVAVATTLGVAWVASFAGLEAIIGAFFAGVFLGATPAARDIEHEIEPVVRLFAPVFFVSIGLAIVPAQMASSLGFAMVLTLVAVASKLLGCVLPARSSGMSWRDAAIVGSGMVPRGEVGLIVAGIGASGGFLDPLTFSAAAFACVATILFAPPSIKLLARRPVAVGPMPEGAAS